MVFGEDVAPAQRWGLQATQDLTDRFGPERCFNTPIAESSIIGAAIGMAAAGFKVIPEIQFADYIHPPSTSWSPRRRISFRPTGNGTCPWSSALPTAPGSTGPCTTRNRSSRSTPTCQG